jgi:hypothetical protein
MLLQGNVMPGRLHMAEGFDVDPLQSDRLIGVMVLNPMRSEAMLRRSD